MHLCNVECEFRNGSSGFNGNSFKKLLEKVDDLRASITFEVNLHDQKIYKANRKTVSFQIYSLTSMTTRRISKLLHVNPDGKPLVTIKSN